MYGFMTLATRQTLAASQRSSRMLVGEICASPTRSNGGRKLGSRSPRTRCGKRRLSFWLFVASCLSGHFALSGKRYGIPREVVVLYSTRVGAPRPFAQSLR
jgi:hypothetical protein